MILNLGCGNQDYGDVRVDFVKTNATTHICNLNEKLPFNDENFDEVYCNSVLEHIGNVKQFVEESMRVLKVGGKFYFRTDSSTYLPFLIKGHQSYIEGKCKYDYKSDEDKHYYLFKEEHLINFFKRFGDIKIGYACPSKKMPFFPMKFKCMHIEVNGIKHNALSTEKEQ